MARLRTEDWRRAFQLWISVSLLLFYLQALRVAFSVQFGIIYDQVFEGPLNSWLVASVLLLMSALAVPFLIPVQVGGRFLAPIIVFSASLRIPMTVNDPTVRYWSALGILFFVGIYLALTMRSNRERLFLAMIGAICSDQVLRALGHTFDLSLRSEWLGVQLLWAVLLIVPLFLLRDPSDELRTTGGGLYCLGGLGFGGFLFLESSLLALPNALARWAGVPYETLAVALLLISALPLFGFFRSQAALALGGISGRTLLAALLLMPLIGYFYQGWLAAGALLICQLAALMSWWIILQDQRSLAHNAAVAVGMLILLLLVFLNAFAFTYPYTLPAMRERGWSVYLLASLLLGAAVIAAKLTPEQGEQARGVTPAQLRLGAGLAVAMALILAVTWPKPAAPLSPAGATTLASYNIHYGYDDSWHLKLEAQAAAIREAGVDVIALQEVDAGRLTSYGIDHAHYLGRTLGMNAAYLPTVEQLTGIAVLYKGPRTDQRSALLSSLQEQTGIIGVNLNAGGGQSAYGIWVGLEEEDTLRQVGEALAFIGDEAIVSWGGDFNSLPESEEVAAILGAGFIDPFAVLGIEPAPNTSPAVNPEERIDFVFLRGMVPLRAFVSKSLASDHRMVVVVAEVLR